MRRSHPLRAFAITAAVLVGAGCSAFDDTRAEPAAPREQPAPAAPGAAAAGGPDAVLDGTTRSLPPAAALPAESPGLPPPTGLTIDDLDVSAAPVVPVGVEPDGDMEIPGAEQVGWYRYGPRPGDDGSAVLAAHIAYDGEDGVFRHLADVTVGADVAVDLAGGESRTFVVTDVVRYPKDALPDDIFARDGDPGLVLVTCGGEFDSDTRSYEDNVVAYARPA
ncbi:MAG: class F sortase [Acidimicrobiales bacterium]|nr:class F sortase [Acidimicrobiales bacterium]